MDFGSVWRTRNENRRAAHTSSGREEVADMKVPLRQSLYVICDMNHVGGDTDLRVN